MTGGQPRPWLRCRSSKSRVSSRVEDQGGGGRVGRGCSEGVGDDELVRESGVGSDGFGGGVVFGLRRRIGRKEEEGEEGEQVSSTGRQEGRGGEKAHLERRRLTVLKLESLSLPSRKTSLENGDVWVSEGRKGEGSSRSRENSGGVVNDERILAGDAETS